MEVVGSKGCSTLGALAKPRVVAAPDALGAEDVEAFGEDGVLLPCAAARAVQFGLGAGAGHSRDERVCKDSSRVFRSTNLSYSLSTAICRNIHAHELTKVEIWRYSQAIRTS